MNWRLIHRWLGLAAGTVALMLGLTGVILAFYPLRDAWISVPAEQAMPVSTLVERVSANIPAVEEIRRLPSGDIVVYSFAGDQARASRVDPLNGTVLGDYQVSGTARWVKSLHRSFLMGDAGRLGAATVALAMLLLSLSGLVLTARRLGGWRRLAGRVRGSLTQRIHVVAGRLLLVVLCLSSLTALYMSATTFALIPVEPDWDPDVVSTPVELAERTPAQLALLQSLRVGELRKLNFPVATDPEDTWKVVTEDGAGWVDRYTGHTLAWQPATLPQRVYDWVTLLHTGEGAWGWALVLGVLGASIPLFWLTGLIMWWQGRRDRPVIAENSALSRADTLIFVASESSSTWGFAGALHQALLRNGHRVHTAGLETFRTAPGTRQVFVLAATYGEGQAPAHAARALQRIASQPAGDVPVTVLGFGDRQFAAFCAYAEALDSTLRARGWPQLLPLERVNQQSVQQFYRWGETLAAALGETLALDYVPRLPSTTSLVLVSRQDHAGGGGGAAAILRFVWPARNGWERLAGRGLSRFKAGDLVGILPPGAAVPRYYSLASGYRDGFLEICVRRMPGGLCSSYLHALKPGDRVDAFIKPNPGFVLEGGRRPVVLIGAGTGVAPLVGFIRDNIRRVPMHLYYGARDPSVDFYFGQEIKSWLGDRRLTSLRTAFSRVPDGGGYVQDALRRDAARVRDLVARGAVLRVCGSRPMAQGVVETLDGILGTISQSVRQLKDGGRYAEDVF
ncbi:oxidoreductase [Pusillimonas sp. TS35]|uniref:PepSY domain-containing protein n=1 Tax=Paracandidimonas lactea TaxID=2895524 RepID=UPI00136C1AC9|nr:PepSY domain-containing protein [Paracandidimonas lactea]MYN12233.1 oxidoreductase [Pusillimonas sp. TS35]